MSTRSSARLRDAARIKTEQSPPPDLSPAVSRKRTRPATTTTTYYDSHATIQHDLELDERALRRLRLEADGIRRALERQPSSTNDQDDKQIAAAAAATTNTRQRATSSRRSTVAIKAEDPSDATSSSIRGKSTSGDGDSGSSSGSGTAKQPKNWQSILDDIREYRRYHVAPVDTMGCERLAEVGESIPPEVSRFQTLISLVLSSQTKDTVTSVAVRRLQRELKGGLTIQGVLDVGHDELNGIIGAVGFHNKKTVFMKQIAEICRTQYAGDIPDSAEGLMALPGVGPKMAYLTLQVAWRKNMGIGVDTHVHRICNRLGWVKTEKDGPEGTRKALQSWLPKQHWREINYLLVGFGQVLCLPRGPMCDICPVRDRCPSAPRSAKMKPIIKEEPLTDVKLENTIVTLVQWEESRSSMNGGISPPPSKPLPVAESASTGTGAEAKVSTESSTAETPPPADGQVLIHSRPSISRRSKTRSVSPSSIPIKQEDQDDKVIIKQEPNEDGTSSKYF
ncbi:DNA N-glycosylase and apurinic/apyrimidinic (AP) lyase [Actinomortierella ambigua]|nr:DNA N-glycosylase and apurinic/apyrimidinic (AP) lyase [Actinomortierella ambigua]